jgi:long-chain fatty acid transport protein
MDLYLISTPCPWPVSCQSTPRLRFRVAVGATLLVAFGTPVLAQNTNDFNAGIQFDFSGARSLGLGGAFVAIADDATTVYGNPAGLTTFTKKEVSFEYRRWGWTSTVASGGHAFGRPTGTGIDTVAGVTRRTTDANRSGPSFGSFVYPFRNWGFGVFARAQSRYEMNRQADGTFFDCAGGYRADPVVLPPFCEPHARQDGVDRLFPSRQSVALDITSVGGAVAYKFRRSPLAVGISVQRATFEIAGQQTVFSVRDAKKYLPADFSAANIELISTQSGNDANWAFSSGLMWTPNDYLSVAGSYQYGPTFNFRTQTVLGPTNPRPGLVLVPASDDVFNVPDQFTLGAVYRVNPNASNYLWLVSGQYDYVRYTDLLDQFHEVLAPQDDPESRVVLQRLRIDDAHVMRAGSELTFTRLGGAALPLALAVRGGVSYSPAHQTFFQTDDPATGFPDPRVALYFPRGTRQWHGSIGAGVALGPFSRSNLSFQLDLAADVANRSDTFAFSTVVRF